MSRPEVLLVGCGNMGQALLRGWLDNGWTLDEIHVVEPEEGARTAAEALGLRAAKTRPDVANADVVVLAVKPQQLGELLPDYRDLAEAGCLFLSIAAGKPISFYEAELGSGVAVVRGMPNTPAAIGRGMTVLVANEAVDQNQRALCESLMGAVGEVAWVAEEGLMNAVTAVSGSGPAYVFFLVECLADAGVEMGLARELADQLALATVAGAGAYASGADFDPAELRRRVTSPGGTTEAALKVLGGDGGLRELMTRAVRAATERGRGLA